MAREFLLPDIGEGLTEAEIVRWLVPEGETVVADQPIVEVETDKAVVEIPTPYAGVVLRHGGAEGQTIEVGSVLVTIGDPDEAMSSPTTEVPKEAPEPVRSEPEPPTPEAEAVRPRIEAAPIVGTLTEEAESLTSSQTGDTGERESGQIKALPVVRKLARDHGIDLSSVTGSGPGGRITRQDVEKVIGGSEEPRETEKAQVAPEAPVVPVTPAADSTAEPTVAQPEPTPERPKPLAAEAPAGDPRQPMSRLRRTIAANMVRSWTEIPHVTTFDDVDATRLLEVREALTERHGVKIPIEALVIKAVVPALAAFPEFNASIDGDDVIFHGSKDIGIAVDTPDGLMVAVVRDAANRGVLDLTSEIRRLGEGARTRTLRPDELSGQTFTVSNIGAVGGGHGTPLVPPGTTAILSVGRAKDKPVVYQGDLMIAPVMPLSLSYDHRIIDGAVGRRFMALLLENLEEPALFLAG